MIKLHMLSHRRYARALIGLTLLVLAACLYAGCRHAPLQEPVAVEPLPLATSTPEAPTPTLEPTLAPVTALDLNAWASFRQWISRLGLPFIENVVFPEALPGRLDKEKLPDMIVKKERVNILLLGIDQRPGEQGPSRSDTMILVSIDPSNDTAAMLSIPRDLWVMIPGYGESRINVAHFVGESQRRSGGGGGLAKETVSQMLGVPVHYYVIVDFVGFERLIDAIGGVTVHVNPAVPPFAAGPQHMDGPSALRFARTRRQGSDFDRIARQQKVLMAAASRVRSLNMPLSTTLRMLRLADDTVKTDLSLQEMLALTSIAKRIDQADIRRGMIDSSMTTMVVTPAGWMVELPRWDRIHPMVDDLLGVSGRWSDDPGLVQAELATDGGRIALYNGTNDPRLADAAAEVLTARGFRVVRSELADRDDYTHSVIMTCPEVKYQAEILAVILGIPSESIRRDGIPESDVDIVLILGEQHLAQFGLG